MSKLDKKKAEIETFRVYRNFALTSLLALIAFIATKFSEINAFVCLSVFAIIVLGISVFCFKKGFLTLSTK